ncbi:hypothetical protein HAX54_040657 [Datura stramonium]|uniref:Uncharacterized protein n=1 Tax=Datura stramonium TaxID=4076 RepID=A0ABS8VSU4_DATST|nr:hypothetical protein [Datura stramonium]
MEIKVGTIMRKITMTGYSGREQATRSWKTTIKRPISIKDINKEETTLDSTEAVDYARGRRDTVQYLRTEVCNAPQSLSTKVHDAPSEYHRKAHDAAPLACPEICNTKVEVAENKHSPVSGKKPTNYTR